MRIIPPKKHIDNEKTRWYIDNRLIVKRLIFNLEGFNWSNTDWANES